MAETQMAVLSSASDAVGSMSIPSLSTYPQQQNASLGLSVEQMTEILQGFYEEFNSETNYLLIGLYVPVFVLAMTANILVIVVVFKYQYMRSVTNYFVVNLSVADLLVTCICMPMAISQAVSIIWVFGEVMCKLFYYLQARWLATPGNVNPACPNKAYSSARGAGQHIGDSSVFGGGIIPSSINHIGQLFDKGVAVAASVFTITAMSIDRYLAIRSPIALRRIFNRKSTLIVIASLWVVALSIFAPVLRAVTLQSPTTDLDNITFAGQWSNEDLQMPKPPSFYVCSEDFKSLGIHAHVFGAACFVLVYAVPGLIVIIAYSMMGRTLCARKPPFDCDSIEGSASSQQGFRLVRERKRIAWILLLLAVLFALCWLPYNVLRLLVDLGVVQEGRVISDVLSYCLFLGHANSALNPIVYCFMTRNFRRSVAEILCLETYGMARRRPHRQTLGSAVGVYAGGNAGKIRGSHYQQKVLLGSSGEPANNLTAMAPLGTTTLPLGTTAQSNSNPATAVLVLNQRSTTTSSSSGYDSYYSRHSPHRRCYMLKSMPQDHDLDYSQKERTVAGQLCDN